LRVLITGITGFAGSHLAEHIVENHPDVEVFGACRWRSRMEHLRELGRQGKLNNRVEESADTPRSLAPLLKAGTVTLLHCDLTDAVSTRRIVDVVRPDWIFHLAAGRRSVILWCTLPVPARNTGWCSPTKCR
jgi:GDP-4-dehydro-6-deoxy-D-mannose reductase